ncbi:MAG: TIGR03086 family metal-binding protein [Actinomycetota bacterium]
MLSDDQMREALDAAMTDFVTAVEAIRPEQWGASSPCEGWTVHDVVDHVVLGDHFCVRVISGASMSEAIEGLVGIDPDQSDVVGVVRGAAADARTAFAGPLDREVDHPVGVIPARRFLGFRILDQLGHAWDLQMAIRSQPVRLDQHAIDVALQVAAAEREMLESSAHFATAPGDGGGVSGSMQQFLTAVGRRADWQP